MTPAAPQAGDGRRLGLASVAVAATLFGTAGVARGLGPDSMSSILVGSWRILIGGAVLVAASAIVGPAVWRHRILAPWPLVGGAAALGYQLAFFAAADRVGVGPAAVVTVGTAPIVAGLADRILHGHRPSLRWMIGVAIALAGVLALSGSAGDTTVATGWLFALAAGACYPISGLAAQRLMADRPPLTAIATVFGVGGALAAIPAVLAITDDAARIGADGVAVLAYAGIMATGVAYGLWARGLSVLSLSDTVAVTLAEPVAAIVLSALLLDEAITPTRAVAMALILGGVALATVQPAAGSVDSE